LSHSDSATTEKAKWSLTREAFDKLLNAFSPDRDEAAAKYELMRRKLVRYYEWRGIEPADEYADETLNRTARRIDEGQIIDNLMSYIYAVARLVFMEALKSRERAHVPLPDVPPPNLHAKPLEETEPEPRVVCLDECLESLPVENRKLIIDYYQEERRAKIELRQELADRLAIPLNALRIRAHRIRITLEQCINRCVEASESAK
jgi:DNA-directed RNA polymerase specialized sigma24 family protein